MNDVSAWVALDNLPACCVLFSLVGEAESTLAKDDAAPRMGFANLSLMPPIYSKNCLNFLRGFMFSSLLTMYDKLQLLCQTRFDKLPRLQRSETSKSSVAPS